MERAKSIRHIGKSSFSISSNGSQSLFASSKSSPRSEGSASPTSKAWGRAGSKEPVVGDACEAN